MYANKEESGFLFWWWSNYTPDAHNQRSELFDFKITQLKRCKSKLIFVMGSVSNIQ